MAVPARPTDGAIGPTPLASQEGVPAVVTLGRGRLPLGPSAFTPPDATRTVEATTGLAALLPETAGPVTTARPFRLVGGQVTFEVVDPGRPRRLANDETADAGRRVPSLPRETTVPPEDTRMPVKTAIRPPDDTFRLPGRPPV